MKQLISLIKAVMSQDMNLFKIKAKKNSSKLSKTLMPIVLALIFMFAIGSYWGLLGQELHKMNLTYIMLTIAMAIPTILTLIEGIYKSQGILFEAKDNELLFSMPIKKSKILFVRLLKLWVFQYLYNLLFVLPALIIYIIFENPGVTFYIISIIMTILLPIIPTIIACFIGFLVKNISIKFKAKKIVQTILTTVVFIGVVYLSFNTDDLMQTLLKNATNVNELILKIYYPLGAYIELINKFNILTFLKLIAINIIPLILFIMIVSKFYFSVISKSSEKSVCKRNVLIQNNKKIKSRGKLFALTLKELKRYFSSTVYMFNTLFGLILMLVITIALCININGTVNMLIDGEEFGNIINQFIINMMPKIFYGLIIFTSCMTSITSSSISLEGKSFNITKSLPVKLEKVLLAKIMSSNIISISIILICDIIFCIFFKTGIFDTIVILLISIIMPTLIAIIGLLINLKYPKMDASSDAEVVKQSTSSMISVLLGMILAVILIGIIVGMSNIIGINLAIIIELLILTLTIIIFWNILKNYGKKRIKEIDI